MDCLNKKSFDCLNSNKLAFYSLFLSDSLSLDIILTYFVRTHTHSYTHTHTHTRIYIYIYIVGLTSSTLSRRLTMHLSDTSSIAQHLKKHSCPTTQLRKILTDNTTILKIINKNFRFSKHSILETCNQHLIELIIKPVLTYLNVFSYWHYLQNYI